MIKDRRIEEVPFSGAQRGLVTNKFSAKYTNCTWVPFLGPMNLQQRLHIHHPQRLCLMKFPVFYHTFFSLPKHGVISAALFGFRGRQNGTWATTIFREISSALMTDIM